MVPAPLHLMHVVGPRSSREAACTEPNMRGNIDASPSHWNTHTAAGRWESPVRNIAKLNRNRLQGDEPMGGLGSYRLRTPLSRLLTTL